MKQVIVTEGKFDKALLEKVLPEEIIAKTKIDAGMGATSALSLARSYCINGANKILVVIDSDSNNERQIYEKKSFAESFLSFSPSNSEMKVVLFIPELESIFFADKSFIEKYFGKEITPTEFDLYKRDPEYALEKLSGGKLPKNIRLDLLNHIDSEIKGKIRNEPGVKEIIEYFTQNSI